MVAGGGAVWGRTCVAKTEWYTSNGGGSYNSVNVSIRDAGLGISLISVQH